MKLAHVGSVSTETLIERPRVFNCSAVDWADIVGYGLAKTAVAD